MQTPDMVDEAAHAWLEGVAAIAGAVPGGLRAQAQPGLALLATGAPLASVNGVFDVRSAPRRELVGDLAARAAEEIGRFGVPWCIQVRTGPDTEIAEIAAAHGLAKVTRTPLMVRGLDGPGATLDGSLPAAFVVRQLGPGDSAEFAAALAAGFEAPAQVMNRLGSAEILALPGATGYLAEADGAVVATGLALRAGGCVGIFNISVPPERRRQGYGAAVTSAILAAARERGARLAFLHSSAMGRSVYEYLGFRTVEEWTRYT
ncbi:GNAT family N-acetyltransferase [Streptomyces hygroscopicus]|uniref:GNAT family N-acetyltransferase n=1 Tax=Streptomyces sp. KHY 26 TaxID=3097359 RepID=UPI0025529FB7|nr:GNAT family N-acetyltransferase [Streptomyces hygroscopicus]